LLVSPLFFHLDQKKHTYHLAVTNLGPKSSPACHSSISSFPYPQTTMRGAFVVRLGPETKPKEGKFDGCIEEVDSGIEVRFHSGQSLLEFIAERFEVAMASTGKTKPVSDVKTSLQRDSPCGKSEA
jgi:hypothetical protein